MELEEDFWNYFLRHGRPSLMHSSSEVELGMFRSLLRILISFLRKDSGILKKKKIVTTSRGNQGESG